MQSTSSSKPSKRTLWWARLSNAFHRAATSELVLTLLRWVPFTG
jgi:hypothetical protein